jgi:hypothetical protein
VNLSSLTVLSIGTAFLLRFTPHKSITVNAPSRTIHVSSLRKELCKEQTLRNIFQQHGKVEALQLIRSADRNMALVRYATI